MKITILTVGKIKEKYLRDAIAGSDGQRPKLTGPQQRQRHLRLRKAEGDRAAAHRA